MEQKANLFEYALQGCKWEAKDLTHCLSHFTAQAAWSSNPCHVCGGTFQKDYAEQLRKFCKNHNLDSHIDFLPQLNRQQLARFFQLQHVCVFTSLHPEAFGIVAVEAMASGLALVSTGVGGASEVFENEISGLSYPAGDSTALAEQLERLAGIPVLLNRLQQAGENRVKNKFSVNTSVRQLENMFKEANKKLTE